MNRAPEQGRSWGNPGQIEKPGGGKGGSRRRALGQACLVDGPGRIG